MADHSVPRDQLRKIKLFEGCSPEELDRIDQLSDTLDVAAGSVLAQEGHLGKEFVVIVSGSATISREGKELATIGAGDYFGEIALLDGRPRTTDAIAHTNCELAILERRDFLPFIRSQPLLAMKFVELLCMRLRRTSEQIEHIILQDLSGRLAGALLGLADRRQPDAVSRSIAITQQELGEMVGMTRESINKQLREWAERKWVRLEHGGILLLDAKALANVAETGRADDSWNVHPNT